MKTTLLRTSFLLLFIGFLSLDGVSQNVDNTERSYRHWELGLQLGFGQYYGDISDKGYFEKLSGESRFSGSLLARWHANDRYGVGFQVQNSGLYSRKDNYANGSPLNLEYSGRVFEIGVHGYLNFSNLFLGPSDRRFSFYGTIGVGYISWNGSLKNSLTGNIVYENGSNIPGVSYKTSGAVIPTTLGLSYAINNNLSLDISGSLHTVLSDDVDFYADGFKNDILLFTHIGLSYHLNPNRSKRAKTPRGRPSDQPVDVLDLEKVTNREPIQKPAPLPVITLERPEKVVAYKDFEFRVQIFAKSKPMPNIKAYFSRINFEYPIVENTQMGLYRYSTGSFQNFNEAARYAELLRQRGIHDAFVVAYRNNQRISISSEMKQ